ncbi:MAG: RNA polymerase factor sigma-32 [Mariprofundales bacterium]
MSVAVNLTSLNLFYRELRRMPRFNREEEQALARRWQQQEDQQAAAKLVQANLYVVAAIAREYNHFSLPQVDLIQEGSIGLMQAVKRFDPERGFRLATYASWWIKASIHEYILRSWSIVKTGSNKLHRRVFAGLRKAKDAIAAINGVGVNEVAAKYGVSADKYLETANHYLQRDVSLDAEYDSDGQPLLHKLAANTQSPEEIAVDNDRQRYIQQSLRQAVLKLDARERRIIELRHLHEEPVTLKDLAQEFGVSIERVRQIEVRAKKKLQVSMQSIMQSL